MEAGAVVLGVDLVGRTDTRHDILALGVDEVLTVHAGRAGGRIAGEGDAGCAVLPPVAEDHDLDVDPGAPVARNLVQAAVLAGAAVVPAVEDGVDGAPELIFGIRGEHLAVIGDGGFEGLHHLAQGLGRELVVRGHSVALPGVAEDLLEDRVRHAQDDVAVHREQTPVAVAIEAQIAAALADGVQDLGVQAEVQDRVHHARHGGRATGAHRQEERIGRVAEATALQGLDLLQVLPDLAPQARRILAAVIVVVATGLGRDGESGRHRDAETAHLGQPGTLSTQQELLISATLGGTAAETIDEFLSH